MADQITTQSLLDLLNSIGNTPQGSYTGTPSYMQPQPSFRDLQDQGMGIGEALKQRSINQGVAGTYNPAEFQNATQPPIGTRLVQDQNAIAQARAIPTQQIPPEVLARQKSPQTLADDIGQSNAGKTDVSAKPKTDWVKNITAVLAGLGGLGGTAANIIGGIKHSGTPGDAAINQSTNLLQTLAKYDQEAQKTAKDQSKINSTLSYINNYDADPRIKATAAELARAGDLNGALAFLSKVDQEGLINDAKITGEIKRLDNQKLQGAKQGNIKQETIARREGEIDVANKDTEDYVKLVEKEKPTQNDKIQMKVLEKRLGLTVGANNPIKIESSLRKDFNNEKRIKDLGETVRYVTSAEDLYNQYKKDPNSFKDLVGLDRTIIKSFEKSTEPGSVVMPSEAQGYQKMMSLRSKLNAMYETIDKGGSLTPDVREALMNNMQTLKGSAQKYASDVINVYADKAKSAGIDPKNVLVEFNSLYKPAQESTAANQQMQRKPAPTGAVGKVKNNSDGKMYYYDANKNILGVAE